MTPEQMAGACNEVIASYKEMGFPPERANISLVTPKGFKRPAGFPRGHLLQVKENGDRVWHFNAERILAWLRKAVQACLS